MNIEELNHLAGWLKTEAATAKDNYEAFRAKLDHNAQQPQKQPLENELNALLSFLRDIPLNVLSNEQIRLLEAFDIAEYLGVHGILFINSTIKKSDFDPATAMQDVQKAVSALDKAIVRANNLSKAFQDIDVAIASPALEDDRALVRVEFRSDAAINNVVDWQEWSEKWLEISRGIAMSIDDAPENTQVIGATRGSFILELAGTYLFVRILTGIVKEVTSVAKDMIMLAQTAEDLRSKKLLNEQIESTIKTEIENKKESGVLSVMTAVKLLLPKSIDGEQETALKKSVAQLLEFHRKGGEVDFVAPEEKEASEESDEESQSQQLEIQSLRQAIEELRSEKEELKRLSHDGDTTDDLGTIN